MQDSKLDTSVSKLEAEYEEERRKIYRNVLNFIKAMFIGGTFVKILIYLLQANFANFSKIPAYVLCSILLIKYFKYLKNYEELFGVTILGVFYTYFMCTEVHIFKDYFREPVRAFFLGHLCAAGERLVTETIPTLKYRIIYTIMACTIRLSIAVISDKTILSYQLFSTALIIYYEVNKVKFNNYLFTSYFNFKEQLIKFKNLVDHDIPEAILILSLDLKEQKFANDAFKTLIGSDSNNENLIPIQNHLNHFKIQEPSHNIQDLTNNTNIQINLRTFLELHFADREHNINSPRLTRNITYLCQKSKEHLFEARLFTIMWDKEPCIAVVFHDITQQHTILSLQIANSQKDQILATVSHELKTPLNGILGMLQIMKKRLQHDLEMLRYLSICKNSAKLLLTLVNSILDLNQIRAGKLKLYLETVTVSTLMDDIVNIFEVQCEQKGLYLKVDISENVPKTMVTDKNRLSQVLINLVGNALKFTSKGGIKIEVRGTESGEGICFNVQDTGVGIKEEDQEKLLQMLGRLEEANFKVKPQGTGLGLTISESLVKELASDIGSLHGIQIKSIFGIGSAFSFQIKNNQKDEVEDTDDFLDCDFDDSTQEGSSSSQSIGTYTLLPKIPSGFKGRSSHKKLSFSRHMKRKKSIKFTFDVKQNPASSPSTILNIGSFASAPCKSPFNPVILLVDDNPFNIMVAETLIKSHGYRCKTALSGQEAIDIMLKNNSAQEVIELILMDCQMPIMDGFETTMKLKELMNEKKIMEIPIVALTANDTEDDKKRSFEAGMIDHLSKPLSDSQLILTLNKYVRKGK